MFLPIASLSFERSLLEESALPPGILRVPHRQVRQGRASSIGKGSIDQQEFSEENPKRCSIRDDLVHDHQQNAIVSSQLKHAHTNQWASSQIEGELDLIKDQVFNHGFLGGWAKSAKVNNLQSQGEPLANNQIWFPPCGRKYHS
jgi:hypothetical protein